MIVHEGDNHMIERNLWGKEVIKKNGEEEERGAKIRMREPMKTKRMNWLYQWDDAIRISITK